MFLANAAGEEGDKKYFFQYFTGEEAEYRSFADLLKANDIPADSEVVYKDSDNVFFVCVFHKESCTAFHTAVHSYRFAKIDFAGFHGSAAQCVKELAQKEETLRKEILSWEETLRESAGQLDTLEILYDYCVIEIEKKMAMEQILRTKSAFVFEGWIPARFANLVQRFFLKRYCCCMKYATHMRQNPHLPL